jgi:hypothetical protein
MSLDLNPGLDPDAAAERARIRQAQLGRLNARKRGAVRGRTDLAERMRDEEYATRSIEQFRPHRRT